MDTKRSKINTHTHVVCSTDNNASRIIKDEKKKTATELGPVGREAGIYGKPAQNTSLYLQLFIHHQEKFQFPYSKPQHYVTPLLRIMTGMYPARSVSALILSISISVVVVNNSFPNGHH